MTDGTRRRMTGEQRELQLLDVAEGLFAERGLEGTSVEDIARLAGVTRPVVYHRHGSLEGIFVACVRRARLEVEAAFEAESVSLPHTLDGVIRASGRALFGLAEREPGRWALLLAASGSLRAELAAQLREQRMETIARISDALAPFTPGLPPARRLAAAHVVDGIGEQLGRWWMRDGAATTLEDVVGLYVAAVRGAVGEMAALPGG
jgi:AcrR family transcriptional regulator